MHPGTMDAESFRKLRFFPLWIGFVRPTPKPQVSGQTFMSLPP